MNRLNWKNKRIGIICFTVFIVYFLFVRLKTQTVITNAVLSNTKPNEVWEFVADFSNMKFLNPTITSFNVLSEEGNFDHWKYTVEYYEKLSHWPYLQNVNLGQFSVKPEGKDFIIESTHKTCFLFDIYCVKATGEFRFSLTGGHNTRCSEKVTFQCPTVFSSFCKREAEFQRQTIMNNLRLQFNPDSS